VNASFAGQFGALECAVEHLLPGAIAERKLRIPCGRKEPMLGTKATPVVFQLFQQDGGEQRISVFPFMESFP
jgi:hypothetical protein